MTINSESPIPVAIIGGSGYGAGELMRLLSFHPFLSLSAVISRSHSGKPVAEIHTNITSIVTNSFESELALEKLASPRSAVVVAVPHGASIKVIQDLHSRGLPPGCVVVDLSGDLRLRDGRIHEEFYPGVPFSEELRSSAVYGLSELNRSALAETRMISNPGCLATAAIVALRPAVEAGFSGAVAVDAKTGTSGAGREPRPDMHHPSRYGDVTAYKVLQHRHEPEILQALGDPSGARLELLFVPHLLPVSRGIFTTCYLSATGTSTAEKLVKSYTAMYETEPFIRLRSHPPRLNDVVGTNFCDLFVTSRGSQVVVMTALDNLGKGMAGQAIQNLNIAFGFPETTGLMQTALGPV